MQPSDLFASNRGVRMSRSLVAMITAAVAASVIGVGGMIIGSLLTPGGSPIKPGHLLAAVGIALFWAPAIAFVPAAVIGFLVERPKARAMIERRQGGLIAHLLISTLAGAAFGLLFRFVLYLFDPRKAVFDPLVLQFCTLIGFCSGWAWWYLVVLPGRRG